MRSQIKQRLFIVFVLLLAFGSLIGMWLFIKYYKQQDESLVYYSKETAVFLSNVTLISRR